MKLKRTHMIAGGAALALVVGGAGAAAAVAGGDDGDATVTGPQAEKATTAALAAVPGEANSVELDNENGATWEVEVSRDEGGTVDVRLDENFEVVVVEGDSEDADGS
jgi:uncharacterized membrane protein YkoI